MANNVVVFDPAASSNAFDSEPAATDSTPVIETPSSVPPPPSTVEGGLVQWAENEWGQLPAAPPPPPVGGSAAAAAPLRKLLGLKESDQLKILNLQRYLAPHYPEAKAKKAGGGFLGWIFGGGGGGGSASPSEASTSVPTEAKKSPTIPLRGSEPLTGGAGGRRSGKSVALAVSELMDEASAGRGRGQLPAVDAVSAPLDLDRGEARVGLTPPRPPLGPFVGDEAFLAAPSDVRLPQSSSSPQSSGQNGLGSSGGPPTTQQASPSSAAIFTWLEIVGGGLGDERKPQRKD